MNWKLTSGIPEMRPINVKAPWYSGWYRFHWSTETAILEEDKNVLMNGGWPNDNIIYAGMQLLKGAFPHLKTQSCSLQTALISREELNFFNVQILLGCIGSP